MAQSRVQFAQIESYQPAIDYRKTGVIGVVDGTNFAWDAAGVGAAFATRLIAADDSLGVTGLGAAEIEAEDDYHVAVGNVVSRFVPTQPGAFTGSWETLATLANVQVGNLNSVPQYFRGFTSVFMSGATYVCGWNHGVYRYTTASDAYVRLTAGTIAGFPADSEPVIAICETNGRLLLMTADTLYWSGPATPEVFTPTLGGAGFQLIGEFISGEPRAITPTPNGAIIWTTQGALAAEFIGGEGVFRLYEMAAVVLPLSQRGVVRLKDGRYVILTRTGLYQVNNFQVPQPLTLLFNEFLREYMRNRALEVGHLWYSEADDRLFLGFRTSAGTFIETFALNITLDRWGILSDLHLGMFHYISKQSPFAYMNPQGVCSYFLPARAAENNKENPFAPGTFTGLASCVVLGFVRSEQLVQVGDDIQEMQEVVPHRAYAFGGFDTTLIDEGLVAFGQTSAVDEGLVTDTPVVNVDEGFIVQQGPTKLYKLEVLTDLFSPTEGNPANLSRAPMTLAKRGVFADVWTGNLPGFYFRLKFIADEDGEYFKINAVDCTLAGAGQLV